MKEYSKMRKLAIIILIVGLSLGTLILVITAISENNYKNKQHNGLLHQISNQIDQQVDDNFDDPYYDNFNKTYKSTKRAIDGTIDAYGNLIRTYHYMPYYFIGGFIIFISVGSAVTLFIISKVKENKQEQVNK